MAKLQQFLKINVMVAMNLVIYWQPLPTFGQDVTTLSSNVPCRIDPLYCKPGRIISCWNMECESSVAQCETSNETLCLQHWLDTNLISSASNGSSDLVQSLLSKGATLEAKDDLFGLTAIHAAANNNHSEIVQLLIEANANLDAGTNENVTALHYAAYWGNVDAVNLLIDHGARIDALARDGCTPLIYSAWNGKLNAVKVLVERGADLKTATFENNSWCPSSTVLMCAATANRPDIVRYLLSKGASQDGCNHPLCNNR